MRPLVDNQETVIADVVGEIVSTIVGNAIGEGLFPRRSHHQLPPPEGEWNASLGYRGVVVGPDEK